MKLRNKKTGEIKEYTHTMTSYHVPIKGGYEIFTPWKPEEWEELEDVEEPLIKDERIRRAVRAWYELFDENRLGQFEDGKYIAVGYREFVLQTLDTSLTYTFELPFIDGMQSLKRRWGLGADYYTIAELCGEEKE